METSDSPCNVRRPGNAEKLAIPPLDSVLARPTRTPMLVRVSALAHQTAESASTPGALTFPFQTLPD